MLLLGERLKGSEIADRLALSVKTVSTYRARLLHKMNLTTNSALIRYALEHGLAGKEQA